MRGVSKSSQMGMMQKSCDIASRWDEGQAGHLVPRHVHPEIQRAGCLRRSHAKLCHSLIQVVRARSVVFLAAKDLQPYRMLVHALRIVLNSIEVGHAQAGPSVLQHMTFIMITEQASTWSQVHCTALTISLPRQIVGLSKIHVHLIAVLATR